MRDVLLMVLNPRRIPECVASIEALDVDRCWFRNLSEWDVAGPFAETVDATSYRFYLVVSDDGIVTDAAVELVVALLEDGHPAVTGYCNLDEGSRFANLTKQPLTGDVPGEGSYGPLYTVDEADGWPEPAVPTGFMGMSVTGMGRDLWREFPFAAFGGPWPSPSFASDFHLSSRLRDAGVPMVAARGAFTEHVKVRVNERDDTPGREIRVGFDPAEVLLEVAA